MHSDNDRVNEFSEHVSNEPKSLLVLLVLLRRRPLGLDGDRKTCEHRIRLGLWSQWTYKEGYDSSLKEHIRTCYG